jgi:hypothetical protein
LNVSTGCCVRAVCFRIVFFLRPEKGEKTDSVFDELRAGRIGNFHIFKWRLAMSMHGAIEDGVRLGDIWDC